MTAKKGKFLRVRGFSFSGLSAGLKENGKRDLALIASEPPAVVVGAFTTNKVRAAPVTVSMRNIQSGLCGAVIVNSGNANACTGARGLRDARAMVRETARALGLPDHRVLVCSTGKIGVPLPIEKILKTLPESVASLDTGGLTDAAEAILTTDDGIKVAGASGRIGGKVYSLAGFAKGAGMIAPRLKSHPPHATMLAFLMTDAAVPARLLGALFDRAMRETFNCVTVDGDTSTNDTLILMANGLAGNRPLKAGGADAAKFYQNLLGVMDSLARAMVLDGEGATKCVAIRVRGARTDSEARRAADAVANSLLVKTAFFGEDPNWGRILAAAGRSGATLDPQRVDISYDSVTVARRGASTGKSLEKRANRVMKKTESTVTIDLNLPKCRGTARVYTSDLTLDYVKLNSYYRT